MGSKLIAAALACAAIALISTVAGAAPSLDIQKPPVGPVPSWTGPWFDPDATRGQWFIDRSGTQVWRTHEFHDNAGGSGGGPMGTLAIEGRATNVVYLAGPGTDIVSFDICVWIRNDLPGEGPWEAGGNRHGESLAMTSNYSGCMYGVKLTTSFAIDAFAPPPYPAAGPYIDRRRYIVAINHDGLAWYCWTRDNPDPNKVPWGDYYVPTWDVGDIPVGGEVAGRPLCKFIIMDRYGGGPTVPIHAAAHRPALGRYRHVL